MIEYDIENLKSMTVRTYKELFYSDDEGDNDKAADAIMNISLYLGSNIEGVDDLDIADSDFEKDKFLMALSFNVMCEDCPMVQCDADDFISSDVSTEFEDVIGIDVNDDMTFMDIALKMKEEIEAQAERELDHAIEKAAEEYREHHPSHRSYWHTR